jgi:AcrR family transcriptional regulator
MIGGVVSGVERREPRKLAEPGRRRRLADLKRRMAHGAGWQATKSELTRTEALDAALRCIVRLGFARTTSRDIALEAGISRGALVHHFPTRQSLLSSMIGHLEQRRLAEFRALISAIPATADRTDAGIEAYWRHLSSPLFTAFHELQIAARTDAELDAVLQPTVAAFDADWFAEAQRLFPEWDGAGEVFALAMDITQFLMEGMAINRHAIADEARLCRTRDYLKARLKAMLKSVTPMAAHRATPDQQRAAE